MILRIVFSFIFGCLFFYQEEIIAQDIPIGSWRDHLPYADAVSVTKNGDLIYCAANSAIFIYDDDDNSIERLNLVNGLSDIGISKIKHIPKNNRIVVAYQNGNVDVILEDKSIYNLSFIKNSNAIGSKKIDHIEVVDEFAYLATGIGIVVLNTDKLEFSDTYNFSSTGVAITTNAIAFDNVNIYAASDDGIYYADKNSLNLADFNEWSKITALGNLKYNGVVFFANQLFVSNDNAGWQSDTLYRRNVGVWEKFPSTAIGKNITGLSVSNNKLLEVSDNTLVVYDNTLTQIEQLWTINNYSNYNVSEGIIADDNHYWIADKTNGLVKSTSNWDAEIITPNGPSSNGAFNMDFSNDELWLVSGGYTVYLNENLVNHKTKDEWVSMDKIILDDNGNTVYDMVSVAVNPNDPSSVYVGSWGGGLFEYSNNQVSAIYTAQNSSLDSTFFGSTRVGALAFDESYNLWVCSSSQRLTAITPSNVWHSFSFPGLIIGGTPTSMLVDDVGNKWIGLQDKKSIIVFDDNGSLSDQNDDVVTILTQGANEIPGTFLNAMAKDLDGEIWIGTDEGIAVFYNPSAVFDENIEAEQIYIQQDGQTQILLETEVITTIAIDGANRKWIGTQTSGVYLMSEDGTEQIEHFTTENSPLFSNNIFDIVIDPKTGEVFFGTEKGLISYKGTATDADDDFNNVFVYPNPVKPGFTGTIAIRGLVKDTDVRITDISGNIVYQTTSLGGQAIWDGKDFNGNKVQTGVYMIFNGGPEGERKAAAKILFIH